MIIYASHTKILVRNSLDNTYDLIVQNLEKNIIQGRVQNPKHQFFFIPFCVQAVAPIMRGVWDPMSFS